FKIEPINESNSLCNSDIYFNCFNEDIMINNVVSCKNTNKTDVNCLSSSDEDVNLIEQITTYDTLSINKNKYKKQKVVNRIGAVALSTFVLMGSALISRIN